MTPLQKAFYDEIVLSEEEKEAALFEGRKAKFFRIKNAPYWEEAKRKRPNQAGKGVGKIN